MFKENFQQKTCEKEKIVKEQDSAQSDDQQQHSKLHQNSSQQSTSHTLSRHFDQYRQEMPNFDLNSFIEQKQKVFEKNKIFYNSNFYQKEVNITVIGSSSDFAIVNLSIAFSYFMFEVTVYNFKEASYTNTSNLPVIGDGSFGNVFFFELNDNKMAIKSIPYNYHDIQKEIGQQNKGNIKTLSNSLIEFCFYKLFSVLQIGPFVENLFGFDVLFFSDRIEFSMEMCEKTSTTSMNQLLLSLRMMHSLKIIHGDIKPSNIMWSPTFKKNVFIDFGLSKIIRENIGQMTRTDFFGTYSECSDQMKKLFGQNDTGFVDLYFNDFHGLKRTITRQKIVLPSKKLVIRIKTLDLKNKIYENLVFNLKILYESYRLNVKEIIKIINNTKNICACQFLFLTFVKFQTGNLLKQILTILFEKSFFDSEMRNQLEQNHFFNSTKWRTKQNDQTFELRIMEIRSQYTGSLNQMMVFGMIYFGYDTSPRAAQKLSTLVKQLLRCLQKDQKELDKKFWSDFVEMTLNPYTSFYLVHRIIQKISIKLKMNLPFQENPFKCMRQIAKFCYQKKQINLYQIHFQKIEPLYQNKLGFETFEKEIKSYTHQFPLWQFLTHFKKTIIELNIKSKRTKEEYITLQDFDMCLEFIVKEYKIIKVPQIVNLIREMLKLDTGRIYEKSHQFTEFIEHMSKFLPLSNFYPVVSFRTELQFGESKNFKHIKEEKQFHQHLYQNKYCMFFDFYSNMNVMWSQQLNFLKTKSSLSQPPTIAQTISSKIFKTLNFFITFQYNENSTLKYFRVFQSLLFFVVQYVSKQNMGQLCYFIVEGIKGLWKKVRFCYKAISKLYEVALIIGKFSSPIEKYKMKELIVSTQDIFNHYRSNNGDFYQTLKINYIMFKVLDRFQFQSKHEICRKVDRFINHIYEIKPYTPETIIIEQPLFNLYKMFINYCYLCGHQGKKQVLEYIKAYEIVFWNKNIPFQYLLQHSQIISLCYAMNEDFEGYFRNLKILMAKMKQASIFNEKLTLGLCQNKYIKKYILCISEKDIQMNWMTPIYQELYKFSKLKQFQNEQIRKNANMIYVIEKYFYFMMKIFSDIDVEKMYNLLKLASKFIEYCDIMYKKSFIEAMNCWSMRLFPSTISKIPQRKLKKLLIAFLRNPQYIYPQLIQSVIDEIKVTLTSVSIKIQKMILDKIFSICIVRQRKILCEEKFCSSMEVLQYHKFLMKRQCPEEQEIQLFINAQFFL